MKLFPILFAGLILVFVSCGKKENKPLLENEKALFESVLVENDKIVKSLLTTEEVAPDIKALSTALTALESAKGGLEEAAIQMKKDLATTENSDAETAFKAYSKFSESLAIVMKERGLQSGRNRFYCPMVKKTWVLAGQKIQNPYAPDMRECGDLIP